MAGDIHADVETAKAMTIGMPSRDLETLALVCLHRLSERGNGTPAFYAWNRAIHAVWKAQEDITLADLDRKDETT